MRSRDNFILHFQERGRIMNARTAKRGIEAEQFSVPDTWSVRLEYIGASVKRTFGSCLVYQYSMRLGLAWGCDM